MSRLSCYPAVRVRKATRALINQLAAMERRTLCEVVAVAIEERFAKIKALLASKKMTEAADA